MLLAKLGAEGVTLSSNIASDASGAVEESTLVASLCDFLERVWSHGLQHKRGKSALWSYLNAYQEQHQHSQKINSQYVSKGEFIPFVTLSFIFSFTHYLMQCVYIYFLSVYLGSHPGTTNNLPNSIDST